MNLSDHDCEWRQITCDIDIDKWYAMSAGKNPSRFSFAHIDVSVELTATTFVIPVYVFKGFGSMPSLLFVWPGLQ